jgi:hypothetical protein
LFPTPSPYARIGVGYPGELASPLVRTNAFPIHDSTIVHIDTAAEHTLGT